MKAQKRLAVSGWRLVRFHDLRDACRNRLDNVVLAIVRRCASDQPPTASR
jgi:predicted nucleic acid-binding OB-fold protein